MSSVRASSSNGSTTGTAMSVAAPTGTTSGDLVVVWCHANGQTTIADNNGSTPFTKASITGDDGSGNYKPNTTGGQTAAIFTRRIVGGDPSTYNFTSGASGRWSVVAVTIQSPHPTQIFDAGPTGGNNTDSPGTATSGTCVSITTNTANAIDFPAIFPDSSLGETIGAPSTYTSDQLFGTAGDQPLGVSHKVIASPGATGTRTYTWTNGVDYFGISLAIIDDSNATVSDSRNITIVNRLLVRDRPIWF